MIYKDQQFEVTQRIVYFTMRPSGDLAMMTESPPSPPCGGWPGNEVTLRTWAICPLDGFTYRKVCDDLQLQELEKSLGEICDFTFTTHPTLGRAVVPPETDGERHA